MPDDSAERQFERLRPDRIRGIDDAVDFLSRFSRDVVRQPTHEAVKLSIERESEVWNLKGSVHYPQTLQALRRLWKSVPLEPVRIEVQVLPTFHPDSHEGETVLFARCTATCTGYSQPDGSTNVVHIWSPGDAIRIVHKSLGFFLCQSETGYLGWVSEEDLRRELPVENGESETAPERECPIPLSRWEQATLPWLGTQYVWGGSGREGIDCSGFTQFVYRELGFVLPRDAHQQMLGGRLVATHDRREPLEPGDLLFFTLEDSRIGHVALSLGGYRAIHAERPQVCVFSLDKNASDFNADRYPHFTFAKRYLLENRKEERGKIQSLFVPQCK